MLSFVYSYKERVLIWQKMKWKGIQSVYYQSIISLNKSILSLNYLDGDVRIWQKRIIFNNFETYTWIERGKVDMALGKRGEGNFPLWKMDVSQLLNTQISFLIIIPRCARSYFKLCKKWVKNFPIFTTGNCTFSYWLCLLDSVCRSYAVYKLG